jgi:long-chain fatty acid transport protein
MFKKYTDITKLSLVSLGLLSAQLNAAGFSLNEQSASASGNALAGAAASKEDISFSYWNPALFANTEKTTLYLSGSYIDPTMEVSNVSGTSATGMTSTQESEKSVDKATVPALYLAIPLNDSTVFGLSLNIPFGLSGDYDDDWAGRYHATKSEVQDIVLAFSLANRVNDWVSLGASVQLHKAKIGLGGMVSDFDGVSGDGSGDMEIEDSLSFGYALGIFIEPRTGTRLGAGYRSEVDFDFEGEIDYDNVSTNGETVYSLVDADASAQNTLPAMLTLSAEQDLNDKLTLSASAIHTGWSSLDKLDVDFDDSQSSQSNSVLTFDFKDVWYYSIGLSYQYSDALLLKAGYGIDDSPSNATNLSPRAPDGDRQMISLGGTYDATKDTQVIFSYGHVNIDKASVNRDGSLDEDAGLGTFSADYKSSANIYSFAINTQF